MAYFGKDTDDDGDLEDKLATFDIELKMMNQIKELWILVMDLNKCEYLIFITHITWISQ